MVCDFHVIKMCIVKSFQFETMGKAAEALFTTVTSESVFTTVESLRTSIAGNPTAVKVFSLIIVSSYTIILSLIAFKLLFTFFNAAHTNEIQKLKVKGLALSQIP